MIRITGSSFLTICLFSLSALVVHADEQSISLQNKFSPSLSVEQQLTQLKLENDKKRIASQLNQLILIQTLSPEQKLKILHAQSMNYFTLNDFERAISTQESAKLIAKEHNLRQEQAESDKLIGIFYYYKSMYPQALLAYKASLKYYLLIDAPLKQAGLYNNMALVQTAQSDFTQAIESYKLAENLYQKFGAEGDKIDVRYNIATLYAGLRRYDIAIKMFLDVIEKYERLGKQKEQAKAWGDLGVAYKYAGDYELAKKYALEAKLYFEITNDQYELSAQFHNLAEAYNQLNDTENAEKYARQCLVISLRSEHQKAYVGCLQSLSQVLFKQGHLAEALEYLTTSQKLAIDMDYQDVIRTNKGIFSLIYAADNQNNKAFDYFKRFLTDSFEVENKLLNVQLAKFESEHLSQQVEKLEQQKKLQQLKMAKENQQRNFILLAAFLIILSGFLFYRRQVEKQSKRELESKVQLRTEALVATSKALEEANKVKSQFLANMSHEIRTPLTAVIGQAEAIMNGDIDERYLQKEVGIILGNSHHLLQLINDILDLSKIEANKFELSPKPENIVAIMQEVHDMFYEPAMRKHLSFKATHTLHNPFMVNIDALRLKQILINLCANAVKFTSKGSVLCHVTIKEHHLVFQVTDTGIGMNEIQLAQIFDSFTQGDSSISRRFGGSGLGLFLSAQFAQIMKGKITVESKEKEGSTFTLCLPLECMMIENNLGDMTSTEQLTLNITNNTNKVSQVKNKKSLQKLISTEQHITGIVIPTSNKKHALNVASAFANTNKYTGNILLADDHDDNRRLIARLLTNLGLTVFTASNGREAIELYEQTNVSVILLDIQMPEMDGISAYKALRKLGCNKPIYALTANAMSHEIDEYIALGFDGHLKKPIEREQFLIIIAKYFPLQKVDSLLKEESEEEKIPKTITHAKSDHSKPAFDMSDLIATFKKGLTNDDYAIKEHYKNGDTEKLRQHIHQLAGAAQMFGFAPLSEHAISIELAIKSEQFTQVDVQLPLLLKEIESILSES